MIETEEIKTAYIATQQKSLDDDPHVPRIIKWFLRWVYHQYGWAAVDKEGKSYLKLEFLGIFDTASAARWAAMVPGGSWRELPLNCSLPEDTCQFRTHDFPASSVSQDYRKRLLAFQSVPISELQRLQQAKDNTDELVEHYRTRSA